MPDDLASWVNWVWYAGVAPNDPQMEPYWALAEELDIPVGIHTGLAPPNTPYQCCPKFRNSLGNPALLEEVLIRHQKLRVYLMHAGYPYLQETKAIMHMYPQVYADLGAIDWLNRARNSTSTCGRWCAPGLASG